MRPASPFLAIAAVLAAGALPATALAHARGGWGGGWGGDGWDGGRDGPAPRGPDRAVSGPPEGRITVSRFVAEGSAARGLRSGAIMVTGAPTGSGTDARELAVYEAATVDQLAQAGYRTDGPDAAAGQVAELHVSHDTVAPAEVKRSPVSGTAAMSVSNRGTAYGLGLNVDLTKPRAALVATRLEARIRDKASGAVLWEGRADIVTRDGDDDWPEAKIASRLAAALFDGFPGTSGESAAGSPGGPGH